VGERTRAAAESAFLFGERRLIAAKNKRQPVPAYPLLGPRPVRRITRPPLVGRKADLAQLALLRDRTLAERRPQLVSIVAPAGAGKTRLLDEFLSRLPLKTGFRVATARCLPYGQTLTYWPLRGLLEELLGGALSLEAVATTFMAGGHTQDDADRLAGLILATLGIGPEGEFERESIFGAWRVLVEALARTAPRIIVFEDLHWASESLLDLVEHIMQPRTQAALLIVATSRPELLDRRSGWGGGRRSFTALALEPLSAAETRTLVGKLAKPLSDATRATIAERSGGNPFFAIELARALVGRAPAPQHGVGELATATANDLPDTVQEALQEQLDLLAPFERAALQAAAVAGRTFQSAMLQAILEATDSAETVESIGLGEALDGLRARDLITSAESGAYVFRHILIRDVAYSTLARVERARMHLAAAGWLEQFAAGRVDEFVELIAYHYREAALIARQSVAPLDISVDATSAAHFLERAGEMAARAGAVIEAQRHLEHAIEFAPEGEHPRLYEKLGDCLQVGDGALDAYGQALAFWRSGDASDPLVGARLLRKRLGVLLRWDFAYTQRPSKEEALELRDEAWRLVESVGDAYERWRLSAIDGMWLAWMGVYTPEEAQARMALSLEAAAYFEEQGDWDAFSMALGAYSELAEEIGDFAAMVAVAQRRLAAPALSVIERADALGGLIHGLRATGDFAGALAIAREAIARRRPGEPATLLSRVAGTACYAAYYSGNWSEIADFVAVLDEAVEQSRDWPGIGALFRGYADRFLVAVARDDRPAAERAAATVRQLLKPEYPYEIRSVVEATIKSCLTDDPAPLHAALGSLVDITRRLTPFAIPIMLINERGLLLPQALLDALAEHTSTHQDVPLLHSARIALALASGEHARLAEAIDDAEAHGLIPHAARMRIVLAQRTGDRAHLERARPALQRLGDRQFLRRLEEVASALK
jgi:hypothetical protein